MHRWNLPAAVSNAPLPASLTLSPSSLILLIMAEAAGPGRFTTMNVEDAAEITAPDGSAVRPLCVLPGAASFARFELAPQQVSGAVSHATVQEVWYVVRGGGTMWRAQGGREESTPLEPGVCLTIPLGTTFQFRAGPDGLQVVAATVPPWPNNPAEARAEQGLWTPR
jgi:mannose-6-phosphate isomerase-like protein (cupin superfamily)